MKVICVIPAYNEGNNISIVVTSARRFCNEVIVVDDGSYDDTFDKAKETGAIVLKHPKNMGKGAALRTGFRKALELGAEAIVTLDGDGQHDPNLIPLLIERLKEKGTSIVIGSRFLNRKLKLTGDMPLQRILSNKITTNILKLFFGVNTTDSQSGFRAYRREVIEEVSTKSNDYIAESEALIEAIRRGFRIREVRIPVKYGREKSKIKPVKHTLKFIYCILLIQGFKEAFHKIIKVITLIKRSIHL